MGVIYPKDGDAAFDPELDDAFEFLPQSLAVFAVKIDRVNVLIFFGRVFGVFDSAVGPHKEPFGVFFDIGVVGRTLNGEVHSDSNIVVSWRL